MNELKNDTKKKRTRKPTEKIVFSLRVPPKFHHAFRLEALKKKLTMEELLELYQIAYDKKQERDREEKRAERENKKCPECGQ
jgi:hypothetical protein